MDTTEALSKLTNEIRGWLSAYEQDLRATVGNTNFAVMGHHVENAVAALAEAKTTD